MEASTERDGCEKMSYKLALYKLSTYQVLSAHLAFDPPHSSLKQFTHKGRN